jgi:hypothetical protein
MRTGLFGARAKKGYKADCANDSGRLGSAGNLFAQKLRRAKRLQDKTLDNSTELLVLQERIELSTSPLPRECSTTELLQHLSAREALALLT